MVIPASAELLVHVGAPVEQTPRCRWDIALSGGITVAREGRSTAADEMKWWSDVTLGLQGW
jgi:hypothetical protein